MRILAPLLQMFRARASIDTGDFSFKTSFFLDFDTLIGDQLLQKLLRFISR